MAGFANRIQVILDVTADKAVVSMRNFRTSIREADGAVNKFKAGAGAAMDTVKKNAAAFAITGGAALATFGVKSLKAFQDTALGASKFADATGVGVAAASKWIEVAGDVGVGSDTIESALNRMNKTLGASPEKFAELGVSVARAADGTADVSETFLNVVDRLNAIEDPAKRAATATALLGKGWTGMAELIAQGSDGLRDSLEGVSDAQIISPEEAEKAKRTRAALDNLSDSLQGFTLEVGEAVSGLIPLATTLVEVAGAAADFIGIATGGDAKSLSQPVKEFSDAWTDAGINVGKQIGAFSDLFNETLDSMSTLEKAGTALSGVFGGDDREEVRLRTLKKAFEEVAAASPEMAHQLANSLRVWVSLAEAGDREAANWVDKTNLTSEAIDELEASIGKTAKATADGVAATQAHIDAMAELVDWTTDAGDAAREHVESIKDSVSWAGRAADRTEERARAEEKAADATEHATKALEDHVSALQADIDKQQELIDFARGTADAQFAFERATDEVNRALEEMPGKFDEIAKSKDSDAEKTRQNAEVYRTFAEDVAAQAEAAVRLFESQSNGALTATQKQHIFNQSLVESTKTMSGPALQAVLDYIATTNRIPESVKTDIQTAIDEKRYGDALNAIDLISQPVQAAVEVDVDQAGIDAARADQEALADPLTAEAQAVVDEQQVAEERAKFEALQDPLVAPLSVGAVAADLAQAQAELGPLTDPLSVPLTPEVTDQAVADAKGDLAPLTDPLIAPVVAEVDSGLLADAVDDLATLDSRTAEVSAEVDPQSLADAADDLASVEDPRTVPVVAEVDAQSVAAAQSDLDGLEGERTAPAGAEVDDRSIADAADDLRTLEDKLTAPATADVDERNVADEKAKLDKLEEPLKAELTVTANTSAAQRALDALTRKFASWVPGAKTPTTDKAFGSGFILRPDTEGTAPGSTTEPSPTTTSSGSISHTSTPAVADSGIDRKALEDEQQAAKFDLGELSIVDYRKFLADREKAAGEDVIERAKYHRQVQALDEQAAAEAKAAADAKAELDRQMLEHQDRIAEYDYKRGKITLDQLIAHYQGRYDAQKEYSDDAIDLWDRIKDLTAEKQAAINKAQEDAEEARKTAADAARDAEEKAVKDHLDYVAKLYEQFAARRDAAEADAEVSSALADAQEAAGRAGDSRLSGDERAKAAEDRDAALKRAAEALFRRADATANAAGIEDRTEAWAAAVTASLQADLQNAPGLAPWINQILSGIPKFATGGIVPGRKGEPTLAVVHGGEEVLTADQQASRGGVTNNYFTIHAGLGTDGPRLAQDLRKLLADDDRRNGRRSPVGLGGRR